jgi:hypothetical protein
VESGFEWADSISPIVDHQPVTGISSADSRISRIGGDVRRPAARRRRAAGRRARTIGPKGALPSPRILTLCTSRSETVVPFACVYPAVSESAQSA